MTYDKVKIGFLMTILSIALTSIVLTESFAEEDDLEQERQNAIDQQTSTLFSNNPIFGNKKTMEGYDRLLSKTDPGLGHENHQLAMIIPISDKEYVGTLEYSASEPIQLVSLRGPLEPGEEKGKFIWTKNGETNYEIIMINQYGVSGEWNFVGNALAVHTFKSTPFVIDYKIDYEESIESLQRPSNSLNNVNIVVEFSFGSDTVQIDSFDVFKQVSGFDRDQPTVNLQGIVGIDKSILYRAADNEFNLGKNTAGLSHKFSEFGMSVYLQHGDIPIRKLQYTRCDITNYAIDTLNDKDYSYNRASVFVIVDNFEITCSGMQPYHYDYQKYIEEYGIDAVMKMRHSNMEPKTFRDYGLD